MTSAHSFMSITADPADIAGPQAVVAFDGLRTADEIQTQPFDRMPPEVLAAAEADHPADDIRSSNVHLLGPQALRLLPPLRAISPEQGIVAPVSMALAPQDDGDPGALPTAFRKDMSGQTTGPRGGIERNALPTDPLFANQWHLLNTGQNGAAPGVDMNVTKVWEDFTGRGVTVGIWDDGVDYLHADLSANYDTNLHIIVNGAPHDPFPSDPGSAHGTSVAGLIAAANNGIGTVGVAHGATIAGVDIFFDLATWADYYESFTRMNTFDITNHSWGFTVAFDNNILNASQADFFAGWKDSVVTGRGGLGTINVTSAGNDRLTGRDANDSSKNAMIETVVVAAISHDGLVARYSTPGASVLIGATSNGASGAYMWTTDVTGGGGYNDGTNEPLIGDPDYTSWFGGTSAASPVAAGVVALMLEANPNLGWRDVQTILAATARHTGSAIGDAPTGTELYAWAVNGATTWNGGGMHFSNDYGYGLVDALAAVRLAESWTLQSTSANWKQEVAATWTGDLVIPDNDIIGVSFDLNVTEDMALEHVELKLTWQTGTAFTGDYLITLTSPDGTTSFLSRPLNNGFSATWSWLFMSNQFRGESSVGTWTVRISDQWLDEESAIIGAELILNGAEKTSDDLWIFTNEFGDLADGAHGHSTTLADTNGGQDTLNAAAVTQDSVIDLAAGTGLIDRVAVTLVGFEHVVTGEGADTVTGDTQANDLRGMAGNDLLSGGAGADTLYGGSGADALDGGDHSDVIFGGVGQDQMSGAQGDDTLWGNQANDTLNGDAGADRLDGGSGADVLYGGDGDDRLFGRIGADRLFGGLGNDRLEGGDGNDRLNGGDGADWLVDGQGADRLHGGLGRDVFQFVTDTSLDIILDFKDGRDLILIIGYDFSQFTITDGAPGVVMVGYGADLLEIRSTSLLLTAAAIDVNDFIFI